MRLICTNRAVVERSTVLPAQHCGHLALVSTYQVSGRQLRSGREVVLCTNEVALILYRAFESDLSKLDYAVGQFGQHIKPSLTLERLGRLSNEGHGFSRAVKACLLDGFSR
jgi:hypothetical protein